MHAWLLLFLGALLGLTGCGPGLALGPDGNLSLNTEDLGSFALDTRNSVTVVVSNLGTKRIESIALVAFDGPFAFLGDAYPGTGGTCSTALAAGGSCTIVIVFTAGDSVEAFEGSVSLSYQTGNTRGTAALPLRAQAGLTENGSFWGSRGFSGSSSVQVRSIATFSNGDILVAGDPQHYDNVPVPYITRLNSELELTSGFNPGTGANAATQWVAAAQDGSGDAYLAGSFSNYSGATVPGLVRVKSTGARDTAFNIGTFTGSTTAWAAAPGGGVYVGGGLTAYNGTARNYLVRLNADGSLDTGFTQTGVGFSAAVSGITVATSGKVYVFGSFTTYNAVSRVRLARLNSDGTLDGTFTVGTGPSTTFNALAEARDGTSDIFIAGGFITYNGTAAQRLARIDSSGALVAIFSTASGLGAAPNAIYPTTDGKLYVGGIISSYKGTYRNGIIRINSDGSYDSSFAPNPINYSVVTTFATATDGTGDILLGGSFDAIDVSNGRKIARMNSNGTVRTSTGSLGANLNITSTSRVVGAGNQLFISGSFSRIHGTLANRLARVDYTGAMDSTFSVPVIAEIGDWGGPAIANSDGSVYLSNGSNGTHIAHLNADGSLKALIPSPFVSGTFSFIPLKDGSRLATAAYGSPYALKLSASGAVDSTFATGMALNFGIDQSEEAVDGSGDIFIVGAFTNAFGAGQNYMVRVTSTGARVTSFNVGTTINGAVTAFAQMRDGSGKIYITGIFSLVNGTARNRLARLNSDGSLDLAFDPGTGPNNSLSKLHLDNQGALWIGGNYATYNGTSRPYIARLTDTGGIDTSVNFGTGFDLTPRGFLNAPDGSSDLYIHGYFSTYQDRLHNYLVRISSVTAAAD